MLNQKGNYGIRKVIMRLLILAILFLEGTFIYVLYKQQENKITESGEFIAQRVEDLIQDKLQENSEEIKLLGYSQLGIELESVSQRIQRLFNVDLMVTIYKQLLNRGQWEKTNQKLNGQSTWEDFSNFVIIHTTIENFPDNLFEAIDQSETKTDNNFTLINNEQKLQVIVVSLSDLNNQNLGKVIVIKDISEIVRFSRKYLIINSAICIAIGTGLIIFFYIFLGKVEKNLVKENNQLIEKEIEEIEEINEVELDKSKKYEILKTVVKQPQLSQELDSISEASQNPVQPAQNTFNLKNISEASQNPMQPIKNIPNIDLDQSIDNDNEDDEIYPPEIVGYKGRKRTILVVDDMPINRSLIVELLEPLGFIILEAKNGQEALEKANTTNPDLIITDLMMPILTGFQLIKRLHESPELKNIPIIASSASEFGTELYNSLDAGANAFLPKPVNADTLMQQLQEYLQLEWIYE